MISKKLIIPVFLFSLLFTGAFAAKSGVAMAATNLSWGSRGTEVVQLQQALNTQGYWCGTADGIFGPNTYKAVISFQNTHNLVVDGIVGPNTREALGLTSGSTSSPSRGSAPNSTIAAMAGTNSGMKGQVLSMVATAYDDSYACNYPYYGQPSYIGLPLQPGIVAVDPNVIPMGTKLYVEGYGEAIAADQGGAIKGNRIDLFIENHQQALDFGIQTVKVTILS